VAIAVLHRQGQFLLQLRDDIPGIVYPGYWGFFGGHIESGETPAKALERELLEEINYLPPRLSEFSRYSSSGIVRHVYHGSLTVSIQNLVLREGWDLGLWTLEEIRRGERYSKRANQVRPLAPPHQQILLDFLDSPYFHQS
jgi:8-oxo-dGTP pyrophosphatase MutT (NUDIX family)